MRVIPTHQRGTYKTPKNSYTFEIEKNTSTEVVTFWNSENVVVCSVFTKTSRKKTGSGNETSTERETYGDYELYASWLTDLKNAGNKPKTETINDRKRMMAPDGSGMIDIVERRGEGYFHKQTYLDENLIDEIYQLYHAKTNALLTEIIYEAVEPGKKVSPKKIKGLEYRLREGFTNEISAVNIQSLEMISLVKDTSWIEGRDYRILMTNKEVEDYLNTLTFFTGHVGFDTETTGLKINRFPVGHPDRDARALCSATTVNREVA